MQAHLDTLTKFLAAWGALLSTFGLGWSLYRDLLDRPRIKLSASIRKVVLGGAGKLFAVKVDHPMAERGEKPQVCITLLDEGRRPVLITKLGGQWNKPRDGNQFFFIYARGLPKMLRENQQIR